MINAGDKNQFAVLVVEDDPLLLMDAVDMLEDDGFKVYSAQNADEAICLLEKHDDIRVLFTDVDMPGSIDGLKLAHAVRDRWPPVRIMVTSGLRHVLPADLPENGLFFPKPYFPIDVLKSINFVVDEFFA